LGPFFLYLLPLFLAIWTARVAISRGRNPWIWGGVALVLGLTPWNLLGVAPLLVLLFLPKPAGETLAKPERSACPKCAQARRPTHFFCTNCGWDLGQPYTPDGAQPVMSSDELAPEAAVPVVEPFAQTPVDPIIEQSTAAQPVESQPTGVGSADSADTSESPAESPSSGETAGQLADPPEETVPEPPAKPWGMPEPVVAPTAAAMTARGIGRLEDGRIQEAIDQFTKAIALDPNYREAWEHRAEAYSKQGRDEEAAEDRRQIQGLNASSSPG
jgi:hypothetical protein